MMSDFLKIITTKDGSHTIFNEQLNETYHSAHGAINESNHVFINNGLIYKSLQKDFVRIFEVGFGTGLNLLLTLKACHLHQIQASYLGIEAFPLPSNIIENINYKSLIDNDLKDKFSEIHHSPWHTKTFLSDWLSFEKKQTSLESFQAIGASFDLIYYDAFAPSKQPEMWTQACFEKCHHLLAKDGLLVTYCAQGQFKRNLKAAGFEVESLPGPPNKREMTRGRKV